MSGTEAAKRLFFEALALLDARDYGGAEARLRDALNFAPQSISILTNLSIALMQQNKPDEALSFAERASQIDPRSVEALLVMANSYAQARNFSASLATCDRIIALEPRLAEIHINRAAALNGLHRYEEALSSSDRAISLQPTAAGAHTNRGNALVRLRRFDEALLAYDDALRLQPDLGEAWAGRGDVLARQKRYEAALAAFARAIALAPDLISPWLGQADVFVELRQLDEALAACTRAVECKPELAAGWFARGKVFALLERFDEALAAYDRALALEPDLAEAKKERGSVFMQLSRPEDAFTEFDRAFAIRPDLSYLEGERLHAKMQLCNWEGFERESAHLLASIEAGKPASFPFPIIVLPSSAQQQRQCAEIFAADSLGRPGPPLWRGERSRQPRLRIAYLSPDFREHATAHLAAGLFRTHDRSRFEITAISYGPDDRSGTRQRLIDSCDRFVDVRSRSDPDVATLIRDMEIDIAVDLCGYTRHFRPNILASRPAPVQASYLGYPATMGASHIDYLIADRVLIPPEHRAAYSERIVYLPDSYQVNDSERKAAAVNPSRADLGLPARGFVFCCFNANMKITPDVFDVWMRLLREIEGSVMWLLAGSATAIANLRREAAARGVSPDRLVFAPKLKADLHLARHGQADLFLDTFHCGAHTTASDALWTGLPVLTCRGSTFASRVGASLLESLGLTELIASSAAEYEASALKLARQPVQLAAMKAKLAATRDSCALFDTARFTRNLEAAYLAIWDRFQRGEAPDDVSIDAVA